MKSLMKGTEPSFKKNKTAAIMSLYYFIATPKGPFIIVKKIGHKTKKD